jgi:hypothetical protein
MSSLAIGAGIFGYSELKASHYQDVEGWIFISLPCLLIPVFIWNSVFTSHSITEKGITRWWWQGFGGPLKVTAHFHWTQIDYVDAYSHRGTISNIRFHGMSNGKRTTLWISPMSDPGLKAVRYAVEQLPIEKVTEPVWELLERSQKKWYRRIFR